jgi:hypothetical protein
VNNFSAQASIIGDTEEFDDEYYDHDDVDNNNTKHRTT